MTTSRASLDPARPTVTPRKVLSARFNAEWARLAADPAARRRAAAWPVAACTVGADGGADLAALLAATGAAGGATVEEADAVLADVVRVAAYDELAARVVLQRVLAPLVLVAARRTSRCPQVRGEVFDELVAAAWLVIRTYPLHRRPVKVAVNVVRDAEYYACTREGRLRRAGEVPAAPSAAVWHGEVADEAGRPFFGGRSAPDEVARLFALARAAGVPEDDLDLLDALVLAGRSVAEVARDLRVTPRTVYNRRVAVTARLAGVVAA